MQPLHVAHDIEQRRRAGLRLDRGLDACQRVRADRDEDRVLIEGDVPRRVDPEYLRALLGPNPGPDRSGMKKRLYGGSGLDTATAPKKPASPPAAPTPPAERTGTIRLPSTP